MSTVAPNLFALLISCFRQTNQITICAVWKRLETDSPVVRTFRFISAVCLLLLLQTVALAQANGFKVRYLAGGVETKIDRDDWGNNLVILSDEIRVELKDGQMISVDPKAVTSISYGRRRRGMWRGG